MENLLNAYGFLLLGLLLIVFNLPVLVVVSCSKKLRSQYGVLILSLFNGLVTGVVAVGYGIFRLVLVAQNREQENVPISTCFYNPLTLILLWTFPMNGLGLLINSIDRLVVISFPISYFHYNTRVVSLLNVLAVILNTALVFMVVCVTIRHSEHEKAVNIFCSQNDFLSPAMYVVVTSLRTLYALLAVLLMFVVLLLFMKHNHVRHKEAFVDETMKRFRARQMNYTKTMMFSCIATIALMIIPAIVAIATRSAQLNVSASVSTWTRFVSFFNSFNICLLLIYRQKDIRWRLYRIANRVAHTHIFNVTELESRESRAPVVRQATESHISTRRTVD